MRDTIIWHIWFIHHPSENTIKRLKEKKREKKGKPKVDVDEQ
jgi:hypothetical protein